MEEGNRDRSCGGRKNAAEEDIKGEEARDRWAPPATVEFSGAAAIIGEEERKRNVLDSYDVCSKRPISFFDYTYS